MANMVKNSHRRPKHYKTLLVNFFGLPREVLLDLPRLVMLGNSRMVVENHRGLLEYTEETVRIKTAHNGEIRVTGKGLNLLYMVKEELGLAGRFLRIDLPEGEE
ncbi:MAG TPA: sporulation protein YqfC [Firmicutes bacterium]|jgi:sporulation protein YqfC|nr:sporulation protein YqfC [Bacillota bacterium]